MRKFLSYLVYWLIQLTWGCVMTTIGLLAAIFLLLTGHKPYKFGPNIYFRCKWMFYSGVSFGPIFVVGQYTSAVLIAHEAGHGLQNLIWGPLFLLFIGIPSFVRYWYREIILKVNFVKYSNLPPYDSIWFEGQATRWGTNIFSKEINK